MTSHFQKASYCWFAIRQRLQPITLEKMLCALSDETISALLCCSTSTSAGANSQSALSIPKTRGTIVCAVVSRPHWYSLCSRERFRSTINFSCWWRWRIDVSCVGCSRGHNLCFAECSNLHVFSTIFSRRAAHTLARSLCSRHKGGWMEKRGATQE